MCELLGVSANRKIKLNDMLQAFFAHSTEHPNGWGLAFFDHQNVSVEKEPVKAKDSLYLRNRLTGRLESSRAMAHIRKATIGNTDFCNTHPFVKMDDSGRTWVLVHNGTIFEAEVLSRYRHQQEGETDSERILLYIVDQVNHQLQQEWNSFDVNERIQLIDDIVVRLSKGNKLNLLIYDGDYFYVHKNEEGTLYKSERPGSVVFSTHPLGEVEWEPLEMNRLLVYKDGTLIYAGTKHNHEYVENLEDMRYLYMSYAGL